MKLTLINRLHIQGILPTEGDFITLSLKKDILDKTNLTQKEIDDWEVKSDGGSVTWNTNKAKEVDIDYTKTELELIKKQLKVLDETKKLNDQTFPLYNLFK